MTRKVCPKRGSVISRRKLVFTSRNESAPARTGRPGNINSYLNGRNDRSELPVLVINSSQDMAKEITMQLTLAMPGCSIMYAPTLELARWILRRRAIQLVVSSPVLPDGGISRLMPELAQLEYRPDLVIVGDLPLRSAQAFGESGYEIAAMRPINRARHEDTRQQPLPALSPLQQKIVRGRGTERTEPEPVQQIRSLGADIRNDLNNPLQEIVAMVFVAQAEGSVAPVTQEALNAIDRAAQNMAEYVNKLEDRIRQAVTVS